MIYGQSKEKNMLINGSSHGYWQTLARQNPSTVNRKINKEMPTPNVNKITCKVKISLSYYTISHRIEITRNCKWYIPKLAYIKINRTQKLQNLDLQQTHTINENHCKIC